MSIDLSGAKIDLLDKDYPQKHNDAMDLIQAELNGFEADVSGQIAAFEAEINLEVSEFEAAVNGTVFALQAQFDELESDIEQVQLIARDPTAWVSAILKSRGITNVYAIAFFSNGGAGQKVQASYVTETRPAGRFLGDYASATAAWAANVGGVATVAGDYYFDTAVSAQYECTTLNASSVVRRGSQNYLPAEGVAVSFMRSSTEKLAIFDLTDPLMPTWMEFTTGADLLWNFSTGASAAFTRTELRWDGLTLWAGRDGGTGQCLMFIDFENDCAGFWSNSGRFAWAGVIKERNSALGSKLFDSSATIDNNITGLDVWDRFVVASTDAGILVVKPDKSILKSSSTTLYTMAQIFRGRLYALRRNLDPDLIYDFGDIKTLTASFSSVNTYRSSEYPYLGSVDVRNCTSTLDFVTAINSFGLDMLWPNPVSQADGLIARKGIGSATPPMKKPNLMIACSTTTGAIDASVSYVSDFATGIGTWTASNNAYVTWDSVGSRLVVDRNAALGSAAGTATVTGALVVGNVYLVTLVINSSPGFMRITLSGCTKLEEAAEGYYSGSGTHVFLVRATATSFTIYLTNAYGEVKFTSITAIPVVQNLSGTALALTRTDQNGHATINGSLIATAEVTGGVALISGFTMNTNYLSAPNPWSGVAASDAWLCGVVKCAASVVDERILGIGYWDGSASLDAGVAVAITAAGLFQLYVSNDGGATSVTAASTGTYDDGLLHTWLVRKTATHYYLEVDSVVVASVAVGSHGNLTFHASALATVGRTASGLAVAPNCGIALIGAGIASISAIEALLMHKHLRNLVMNKAALDEVPSVVAANVALGNVEMVGATYHQTMRDGAIVSSVAHGQGAMPVIACGSRGEIGIGGATGCSISVPARNIREAVHEERVTLKEFKFTGNSVLTDFAVDPGWYPISVYEDGVLMESGATKDYVIKDTGLYWFASFAVAPGAVTVTILAEYRS